MPASPLSLARTTLLALLVLTAFFTAAGSLLNASPLLRLAPAGGRAVAAP
jgi:hypothetical protein